MNTPHAVSVFRRLRIRGLALLFLSLIPAAIAAVPLPDHVVYGTIAIDGRPVTREDTGIRVEARRTASGPVIASYRMGATARLGDFYYVLRLPVAESADAAASQAVLGGSVVITVRTASGIAHQAVHQVAEPGVAQRLDFGEGVDTNGDGVPEGWELANLGTSGADLSRDSDGDGASDRAEYFAGTHPRQSAEVFRLALQSDGASLSVSFRALQALEAGAENRTRYYAIESTTDPAGGAWTVLPNLSRIPGRNQLVVHTQPLTNAPLVFRARVWLE